MDRPTGFASDVSNSQFAGAHDPDAIMQAMFYWRPCFNEFKSKEAGRDIFDNIIYCKYGPAGSTILEMNVPSTNIHEARFHRQWAHFKATSDGDAREIGTPLASWPLMNPAAVEELKALKFRTVEHIAAASDQQLQNLGMGFMNMGPMALRTRAQAFLQSASDTALPQKQAEELDALKKAMTEKDAKHEAEMAELRAMIVGQGKPADKPKRIRRTKAEIEAANAKPAPTRESLTL